VTADDVTVGAAVAGSDDDVMSADVMAADDTTADVMTADVTAPDVTDVASAKATVVGRGALVLVMGAVLCAPVLVAVL
jgi:hypothetical protein